MVQCLETFFVSKFDIIPWPWLQIKSYCILSCITHRHLPACQISLKLKKFLWTEICTYIRTDRWTDIWVNVISLKELKWQTIANHLCSWPQFGNNVSNTFQQWLSGRYFTLSWRHCFMKVLYLMMQSETSATHNNKQPSVITISNRCLAFTSTVNNNRKFNPKLRHMWSKKQKILIKLCLTHFNHKQETFQNDSEVAVISIILPVMLHTLTLEGTQIHTVPPPCHMPVLTNSRCMCTSPTATLSSQNAIDFSGPQSTYFPNFMKVHP